MSQPRLLSFTLDGWTALGGEVSLSLVERVGVLVGKNGAGKSAILEGFEAISSWAIGRYNRPRITDSDSIPKILDIEILTPNERKLRYRYELISLPSSIDDLNIDDSTSDNLEESSLTWNDYCQYLDGEKERLWTTDSGVTTLHNNREPIITILGKTNSLRDLHLPEQSQFELPREIVWAHAVLRGVHFLGKVPVRRRLGRIPCYLRVSRKSIDTNSFDLADRLALKIFRRRETEEFDELESVCKRIGIASKITVQKFRNEGSGETTRDREEEYLASVLLDGVNIGLLSDGTLRVLSILIDIIPSSPNATIIIEEPETQIHPGMLAKLLNEIKAYTFDENLIISTHSPQVVSWTSPDKLNLVYRDHGRTKVRKLQKEEIQKVVEYLRDEGDLGEWLYSGILDE